MELTLDEAKAVIGDPQNPNHQAFHKNTNADIVSAVNRAFETAYPGEFELGTDPKLEADMASALNDLKAPQAQGQNQKVDNIPPEVAQAEATATTELRAKWGAEFDGNLDIVREQVQKIFKGDWTAYSDFIVENNIDVDPQRQVEYSEFLLKMGRK